MQTYFSKQDRWDKQDAMIPKEYPPLLQIHSSKVRAVAANSIQFPGLPDASCRETDSCPVTILITGSNKTLAESVAGKIFIDTPDPKSISDLDSIANGIFGTNDGWRDDWHTPLIHVRARCSKNSSSEVVESDFICAEGLNLWRNSSLDVNTELFKGYREGNTEGKTNEILAG
ncbi:hypothetical protein K7X08_000040 [Anisodus acutangulus]|uniref:Uncharacterized protein n=1 Tax=Anisodus acutangulus TaxID=402998 RepID=A0A9Q1M442_9SOLA|nr:hypothetical protein K7X08_000040 [Anisodus acutangulus]